MSEGQNIAVATSTNSNSNSNSTSIEKTDKAAGYASGGTAADGADLEQFRSHDEGEKDEMTQLVRDADQQAATMKKSEV